jgi:hypothetical protein
MSTESIKENSIRIGRILLYIAVIAIAGVIVFRTFFKDSAQTFSLDSEKVQLKYKPVDFKYELDEEYALAVLSNPHRYRREFDELIYNFNVAILHHVAERMGISDSLKSRIELEYEKHHPYLREMYYNDFVNLSDSTAALYETWYQTRGKNAVDALHEVASKYTCFLVNHVIVSLLGDDKETLLARGKEIATPCGIALTEGLRPMLKRLEERAAIDDFEQAKGLFEEKIEEVIAELATMEVRDKKGLTRQMQTKLLGYAVSSTDLEISAISILKVGFRLNEYFDVRLDSRKKAVFITLPEPVVLSHEVYPKLDRMDIGWLREITNADLNKNFDLLRKEFRREAIEDDIMIKAKEQAESLMKTIFGPVVNNFDNRFTIFVRFQRPDIRISDPEDELLGTKFQQ